MLEAFFRNCACRDLSEADASAHVLVVDDEPMILDAVAATLQLDGFSRVTCLASPHEALAHAQASPVDLVLSDLWMPELDGIDLLARIAELHPLAPRILLTGRAEPLAIRRAAQLARPFALIEKPWCNRSLSSEVCRALAWRRELQNEQNAERRSARASRDLDRTAADLMSTWV
jgi:DNA-binding NtrC family response regulator